MPQIITYGSAPNLWPSKVGGDAPKNGVDFRLKRWMPML